MYALHLMVWKKRADWVARKHADEVAKRAVRSYTRAFEIAGPYLADADVVTINLDGQLVATLESTRPEAQHGIHA